MDPNAALKAIADLLMGGCYAAAREVRTDLINWLAGGGFEPEWAKYPEATRYVKFQKR